MGTAVAAIVEHITNPDNLEKGAGSSDKEPSYKDLPPIETAKDAMAKGEAYLKDELAAYDKAVKEREDLFKTASEQELNEKVDDILDKERKAFDTVYEKVVSGDKDAARELANKIEFGNKLKSSTNDIRDKAADFYAMSNGKGSESLNTIVKTTNRAYANPNGDLNIGNNTKNGEVDKRVLFHEMAHHVEFENSRYSAAAREFVQSRATGEEMKLKDITGNPSYGNSEKAIPGDFINPYVGKVYKSGSTEVLSVGAERFHSKTTAKNFIERDREHFLFTVGVLND